jgi:hypothetical protein
MRHRWPSVMIVAVGMVLASRAAAAQSSAPPPPNVAAPQGQERQAAEPTEEVTVKGCLTAAPSAGTSAATTSSGAGFLLKVAPVAAGRNETPSPSGTSSRAPESPSSQTGSMDYALQPATPDVKLQPHIGHTIEIKGHAAAAGDPLSKPQSNEGVSTSQPSGSTGIETIPPPSSRALMVTSVRMISSTCDAAKGPSY